MLGIVPLYYATLEISIYNLNGERFYFLKKRLKLCTYIPPNSSISTSSSLITVALDVLPIMNIIFIDFVAIEASDPIDPISFNLMNPTVVF